jgi:hypothetical protein
MPNAILTALMLAMPAFAAAQASPRGSDSAEAVIRTLNAKEVEAFMTVKPETLAALWSDDFVVTNPLNKLVHKDDVLRMVKSGILAFSSYDRRIEYVRAYGDIVVVAGSETVGWAGRMPLAGKTSELRFTSVWAKQGGRWQQVARHANIVPPA